MVFLRVFEHYLSYYSFMGEEITCDVMFCFSYIVAVVLKEALRLTCFTSTPLEAVNVCDF